MGDSRREGGGGESLHYWMIYILPGPNMTTSLAGNVKSVKWGSSTLHYTLPGPKDNKNRCNDGDI